ncbi:MAG: hypothetical protein R3303_08805 [Marinobacter sp.]|nr:hypothetical protein [Marinobacter sp.]
MKAIVAICLIGLALAGCQNRVLWNDNGKLEKSTQDRKVWDTEGKMDSGKRTIWKDAEGHDVIK